MKIHANKRPIIPFLVFPHVNRDTHCASRRVLSRLEDESESSTDDTDNSGHSDTVESGSRLGSGRGSGGSGGGRGGSGGSGGSRGRGGGGSSNAGGWWERFRQCRRRGQREKGARTVSGETANVDGVAGGSAALQTELEGSGDIRRGAG
jgi:hypothetical protein